MRHLRVTVTRERRVRHLHGTVLDTCVPSRVGRVAVGAVCVWCTCGLIDSIMSIHHQRTVLYT